MRKEIEAEAGPTADMETWLTSVMTAKTRRMDFIPLREKAHNWDGSIPGCLSAGGRPQHRVRG